MRSDVPSLGRVAITGASGFIGRRLLSYLREQGVTRVFAWNRPSVDLLDRASLRKAVRRDYPDTVFHLASAGTSAARAHDVDMIAADVAMTHNLMATTDAGIRLILTGSMSEYGHSGRLQEKDRCTPRTAYGIAKLSSELYAQAYAGRTAQSVVVARLFGVYGPGEAPQRLFPTLVKAFEHGEAVELSDGTQRRDFIHVDDVCAGLCAIAAHQPIGDSVFNLGTGRAVRVRDVVEWIADSFGAPMNLVRFGARSRSPGDEDLLEADMGRYTAMIGEPPPQRLHPGLSKSLFINSSPLINL